ncbi:MAG: ABC transporter substrate-binding protein [Alphaproteobacteria bacterium]|nr:ABC transporter substrate-binding protein [Alphaproteobacteria bacterium]
MTGWTPARPPTRETVLPFSKIGLFGPLAAVAALSLAFAASDAAAQKVLRYVPHANIGTLDPVNNLSSMTHQHAWRVYDSLFGDDTAGVTHPQMVESYTMSADGKVYTIKLRPGLKFHDGTPVRVVDVVKSIERWSKMDAGGKRLVGLGMTLAAVDDRSFTLTLREPFGSTIPVLGYGNTALYIMREKEASVDAATPITEVVGSGPFVFKKDEFSPGNKVVYEKFKDYVPRSEAVSGLAGARIAKVDRIEMIFMPDAATAVAALDKGEIDMYESPPLDLLPVLRRNPNIKIVVYNKGGMLSMIKPNFLHPPFNHPKARQALMHMVDQSDYMSAAIGSDPANWTTCWAVMGCGTPMMSEAGSEPYSKPDIAKAKQLLLESGYKGEKIVVLIAMDLHLLRSLAQVTAQKLRDIGANVEEVAVDWAVVLQRGNKKDPPEQGGWHLFHTGFTGKQLTNAISNFPIGSPCDQSGYRGWTCDQKMEDLLSEWLKEPDLAKRKAIGERIQRQAMEMVQFVPLGQFFQPMATRANITGFQETFLPVFWNVEKN